MSVYLIRHAKAGSRSEWVEDDMSRPLSKTGWRQAHKIALKFAKRPPTALISSPYLRCVQTLQPLAEANALEVVVDERLTEGAAFEPVLAMLGELPDGAVLCSHGDVVPDTIAALQRRGCRINGAADWRKATVWKLDRNSAGDVISAKVWPPPA